MKTVSAYVISAALLASLTACASFPTGSQDITAKDLQQRLAGKTYTARIANDVGWEMRYGTDGRMAMDVSNGTADKGRWRTEDNRLCVDFEGKFPSGCSEMRADAKQLYLKRHSTGEIVALTLKP